MQDLFDKELEIQAKELEMRARQNQSRNKVFFAMWLFALLVVLGAFLFTSRYLGDKITALTTELASVKKENAALAKSNADAMEIIAGIRETGPFGTKFQVPLSEGRMAMAGGIFYADDLHNYYFDFENRKGVPYEVVYQVPKSSLGLKNEIMARPKRHPPNEK